MSSCACIQVYSRLAAVLGSLHLSSGVVAALEQLAELMKSHGARDPFKTASRLSQARGDVRRKQPVHHYRLLGLSQTCASEEVHLMTLDSHLCEATLPSGTCSGIAVQAACAPLLPAGPVSDVFLRRGAPHGS